MAFVCKSCTGAYASANALHNHTRRFPVGSRCPPTTNDENSMSSPLTWMPGRCVAFRVQRTLANEPQRTTSVINTRRPHAWPVGGTSAKMRLRQSADSDGPASPPPALAATARRRRQWRRRQRRRSILLDSTEPLKTQEEMEAEPATAASSRTIY